MKKIILLIALFFVHCTYSWSPCKELYGTLIYLMTAIKSAIAKKASNDEVFRLYGQIAAIMESNKLSSDCAGNSYHIRDVRNKTLMEELSDEWKDVQRMYKLWYEEHSYKK